MAAAAARVAAGRVGEPGAAVPVERRHGRAARPRHDDRERAAARAPVPRHRPPGAARRLGAGLHLDPARLRALLREARPSRRGAPRRLPQGLPRDRRGSRLHRHREPALPEPLSAQRRPQHDAGLPAGRVLLLEREPRARRQRRRPAHGLVALLEQREEPRGLAPDARPLGPLPARARGRGAVLPLRARRRHASLSAVEARALHARARAPARAEPAGRPRPRAREGPVLPQGLAAPRRQPATRRVERRGRERRPRRDGLPQRLARHLRGRAGEAARPLAAAPRARRRRARRSRLRVLDARRRARRALGLGAELAARPARGRPAAHGPVPADDVEDVLGRHRAALALEPPRRRAGRLADGGLAGRGVEGRRVPERPRDRRPGREARGARRRDRGTRARRRCDRGRSGRAVRHGRGGKRRGHAARRENVVAAPRRPRAGARPTTFK